MKSCGISERANHQEPLMKRDVREPNHPIIRPMFENHISMNSDELMLFDHNPSDKSREMAKHPYIYRSENN